MSFRGKASVGRLEDEVHEKLLRSLHFDCRLLVCFVTNNLNDSVAK